MQDNLHCLSHHPVCLSSYSTQGQTQQGPSKNLILDLHQEKVLHYTQIKMYSILDLHQEKVLHYTQIKMNSRLNEIVQYNSLKTMAIRYKYIKTCIDKCRVSRSGRTTQK